MFYYADGKEVGSNDSCNREDPWPWNILFDENQFESCCKMFITDSELAESFVTISESSDVFLEMSSDVFLEMLRQANEKLEERKDETDVELFDNCVGAESVFSDKGKNLKDEKIRFRLVIVLYARKNTDISKAFGMALEALLKTIKQALYMQGKTGERYLNQGEWKLKWPWDGKGTLHDEYICPSETKEIAICCQGEKYNIRLAQHAAVNLIVDDKDKIVAIGSSISINSGNSAVFLINGDAVLKRRGVQEDVKEPAVQAVSDGLGYMHRMADTGEEGGQKIELSDAIVSHPEITNETRVVYMQADATRAVALMDENGNIISNNINLNGKKGIPFYMPKENRLVVVQPGGEVISSLGKTEIKASDVLNSMIEPFLNNEKCVAEEIDAFSCKCKIMDNGEIKIEWHK